MIKEILHPSAFCSYYLCAHVRVYATWQIYTIWFYSHAHTLPHSLLHKSTPNKLDCLSFSFLSILSFSNSNPSPYHKSSRITLPSRWRKNLFKFVCYQDRLCVIEWILPNRKCVWMERVQQHQQQQASKENQERKNRRVDYVYDKNETS